MKATCILVFVLGLLAVLSAHGQSITPAKSIPLDQLGAEAQKQYSGDGIGITPVQDGAVIKAAFQRLEGRVTGEGLWLSSTADEDHGKRTRFRVRAMGLGRGVNSNPFFLLR